jgi:hypothetical protein
MASQVCFAKWLSHLAIHFVVIFFLDYCTTLSLQFVESALPNGSVYTTILLFGYFARLPLSLCQVRFEKIGHIFQHVV